MSSFNKLIVLGNLVGDPDIKDVGEHGLATFSLAINEGYKSDAQPTYIDCEFWRPGKVAGYLAKGKPVLLEGRIQQKRWVDKEGGKRSRIVMIVSRCTLIGGRQEAREDARELAADFG